MARVRLGQVIITALLAVVALAGVAPAVGPAFRPVWLRALVGGVPLSAWLLLAIIAGLLVAAWIISAAGFQDSRAEETER